MDILNVFYIIHLPQVLVYSHKSARGKRYISTYVFSLFRDLYRTVFIKAVIYDSRGFKCSHTDATHVHLISNHIILECIQLGILGVLSLVCK